MRLGFRLSLSEALKPQSTERIFDSSHVPTFKIEKANGNFLSFAFIGFRPESVHLSTHHDKFRMDRADEAKKLAAEGVTQREIAARLGMSLASVNRSLQMWSPFEEHREEYVRNMKQKVASPSRIVSEAGSQKTAGGRSENSRNMKQVEQTEQAGNASTTERDPDEIESARRESALATHNYMLSIGLAGHPEFRDPGNAPFPAPTDTIASGRKRECEGACLSSDADAEGTKATHSLLESAGFKLDYDGYGREIFVEKEREQDGKPMIWYQYGKQGDIRKMVRESFVIHCSVLTPEEFSRLLQP